MLNCRMEFWLIMGIGTVVAILIVANLPKSGHIPSDKAIYDAGKTRPTPVWKKDIAETWPLGDVDYWHKLERYQKDPQHWPCPFPPDKPKKMECEYD